MSDKRYLPPKADVAQIASARDKRSRIVGMLIFLAAFAAVLIIPFVIGLALILLFGQAESDETIAPIARRFGAAYARGGLTGGVVCMTTIICLVARHLWNDTPIRIPLSILWVTCIVGLFAGLSDWFRAETFLTVSDAMEIVSVFIAILVLFTSCIRWGWRFVRRER